MILLQTGRTTQEQETPVADTQAAGERTIGKKTIYFADNADADGPKNIGDFYDLALRSGGRGGILYFCHGKVDDDEARRVKKSTGIDVSGAYHAISDQRIVHTLKRHGVGREKNKGQDPVTKEDFEKIPEYTRTADKIRIEGVTDMGLPVIRYQKRVNGHIVILKQFRDKKGVLQFDTMWKQKP